MFCLAPNCWVAAMSVKGQEFLEFRVDGALMVECGGEQPRRKSYRELGRGALGEQRVGAGKEGEYGKVAKQLIG